ncbi:MAG: hypothetical protein HQK65_15460 [Desulfamplus sp.]|nr:hypothetical protein [Desulfamplus sp.]
MNILVPNAVKIIGILFVGMKLLNLIRSGIVMSAGNAKTGGNGIALIAIAVPTG